MDSNVQTPKSRAVLVGLCAVALFLWTVAVYVTYQDAKMARYNVSIKPGAVNYGTHSTVTMPPVMRTSYRHSTPMISGDVVRAYAHTGHACGIQWLEFGLPHPYYVVCYRAFDRWRRKCRRRRHDEFYRWLFVARNQL